MTERDADHIDESPSRKSTRASIVAVAMGLTAFNAPMSLWGVMLVSGMVWWGLHMVAGLKIKWSYRDC
jgi:uncharacterized membrane protein